MGFNNANGDITIIDKINIIFVGDVLQTKGNKSCLYEILSIKGNSVSIKVCAYVMDRDNPYSEITSDFLKTPVQNINSIYKVSVSSLIETIYSIRFKRNKKINDILDEV